MTSHRRGAYAALTATALLVTCLIAMAVFDAPWLGFIAMGLLVVALVGRLVAGAGGRSALMIAALMAGVVLVALVLQALS